MKSIFLFLNKYIEQCLMVFFLGTSSVIILLQVISRKGFNSSLDWSEAMARYMFIWLIYIGISYAVKTNQHIRVDFLLQIKSIPSKLKKWIVILADILFLMFSLFIFYQSTIHIFKLARFGQTSALFELQMWIIYLAIPFGFFLCSLRLIQCFYERVKNFQDNSKFFNIQND